MEQQIINMGWCFQKLEPKIGGFMAYGNLSDTRIEAKKRNTTGIRLILNEFSETPSGAIDKLYKLLLEKWIEFGEEEKTLKYSGFNFPEANYNNK